MLSSPYYSPLIFILNAQGHIFQNPIIISKNNIKQRPIMQMSTSEFKQQLVHLRSDFNMYLKQHKTKGIPIQHLVILLQKYMKIQPSSLETLLSRTITNNQVTWEHLLMYMEQEIGLQDQVNKMRVTKPSVTEIQYHANPDQRLTLNINSIISYIKKKSTNYIKFIKKAEFLGFKLLVVTLQRQAIFFDCQQKCIIRHVQFKYNNVRNKILNNLHTKQKNYDQYNSTFLRLPTKPNNSQQTITRNHTNKRQQNQQLDKVPPMSRRTEQYPHSFSIKSHKNTNQSEELKNMLTNNMKASKVGSSASVDQDSNFDNIKRSVTMMDYSIRNTLHRDVTKIHKFGSMQNNSIKLKEIKEREKIKKQVLKVRSSDTTNILKLITDCKVEGSMEVIKAYRNSIETFQKYVQIDRAKLQKQKQLFEQYKLPSAINMKFDYKTQIKKMKQTSKQLSLKKTPNPNATLSNPSPNFDNSYTSATSSQKTATKHRSRTQTSPTHHEQEYASFVGDEKLDSANAFVGLERKILEIQSLCFCDNYMVVSLMNCELRLYVFKRTIHGFSQQLIFQKSYHSLVTDVLIYKSSVRKLHNICIILSKTTPQISPQSQQSPQSPQSHQQKQQNIRSTNTPTKHKQTEIIVYELSPSMHIEKQSYMTYLPYSPIICQMLPLGLGGYLESGNFFIIQLNCTSTPKSEIKSVDTVLVNPEHGQRVSLSCLKVHRDLVSVYLGSKQGQIYVYDRLIDKLRIHKKISNSEILQIMFINEWKQVLFWDVSGKVGIFNSNNLAVSSIVSLMGPVGRGVGGNSNGGGYWAMLSYFLDNQFLVYGDRTIGLLSLYENQQKKFHAQKSIKIYNRRMIIKNRTKMSSSQSQCLPESQPQKSPPLKKIHKFFSTPNALIIISCSGQILVHDKSSQYIGSYFTLNYGTVTQSICCPALKYMYLLYDNNDMQVINLYTQDEILLLTNIKEEIYDIFFCHSSVYFCGYLTARKYQLHVYGHGDGRGSEGYITALIVVNLGQIVLEVSAEDWRDREKDSKFSKMSDRSLSTNSSMVEMDIKFFKGSLVMIKKQKAEITFLYKKIYTRNCVIKCLQHIKQYTTIQEAQSITITHTFVDLESSLLTVILSNSVIVFVNLDNKSVKGVYKFGCQGLPFQHYYETSNNLLAVLSRVQQNEYQYSLYHIEQQNSTCNQVFSITHQPTNPTPNQNQMQKNPSHLKTNQISTSWSCCPFLVGKDFATLTHDYNSVNTYKIREKVKGNKGDSGMEFQADGSKIDVQ